MYIVCYICILFCITLQVQGTCEENSKGHWLPPFLPSFVLQKTVQRVSLHGIHIEVLKITFCEYFISSISFWTLSSFIVCLQVPWVSIVHRVEGAGYFGDAMENLQQQQELNFILSSLNSNLNSKKSSSILGIIEISEYYICPQIRLQNSFNCRNYLVSAVVVSEHGCTLKPKLWELSGGWSTSARKYLL